ncbi:MAG: hypothetical protein U5K51_15500 [Flavobacteriaceae bacterium]|nr:hypothetical protein [Flavobacteriaceae bacterium]
MVRQIPFIEEALHDKLIDVSSLARDIQNEVEKPAWQIIKNRGCDDGNQSHFACKFVAYQKKYQILFSGAQRLYSSSDLYNLYV